MSLSQRKTVSDVQRKTSVAISSEQDHWWYRARRDVIEQCVLAPELCLPKHPRVLEAGCGSGAHLRALSDLLAPSYLGGFDNAEQKIAVAKRACPEADIYTGDLRNPRCHRRGYDLILSCDALPTVGIVDAMEGLQRLVSRLAPDGLFLLHLPAYRWITSNTRPQSSPLERSPLESSQLQGSPLESSPSQSTQLPGSSLIGTHSHAGDFLTSGSRSADLQSAHLPGRSSERYTLYQVRQLMTALGLACVRASYRVCSFLPMTALWHVPGLFSSRWQPRPTAWHPLPIWLNEMLFRILRAENRMIASGVCLPWGSSIIAVGRKAVAYREVESVLGGKLLSS